MEKRQLAALKLQILRIDRGLSRHALAVKTGVTHHTIARLEEGDRPTEAVAYKVATFFDLKPTEMWPELLKEIPKEAA